MRIPSTALIAAAALAAAGCATAGDKFKVRAIADSASNVRNGRGDLGEARAQLALGNTGLALEAFRKVQREQPASAAALAGIASCYQAMGRFDLARPNLEAALALSPADPALLDALAGTLEQLGNPSQAAQARSDAARLRVQAEAVAQASSVTVALPPPAPIAARAVLTRAQPKPQTVTEIQASTITVRLPPPTPVAAQALLTRAQPEPQLAVPEAIRETAAAQSSITVKLPPARTADSIPAKIALQDPVTIPDRRPHLERVSMGEVALVTSARPLWRTLIAPGTNLASAARWLPLRSQSAAATPNIRVLNAARHDGLASRARDVLVARGWRRIDIGDSGRPREMSVVLFPASRAILGRRLAAQFGFRAKLAGKGQVLTVLLGRDATVMKALQRRA
jgi:Flp pilus assembly protein TadD